MILVRLIYLAVAALLAVGGRRNNRRLRSHGMGRESYTGIEGLRPPDGSGSSGVEAGAAASAEMQESQKLLPDKVLDAYREAYKELIDNWRSLETKAQGNIAIAGIFIAGAFAFIQKLSPALRQPEQLLLIVALFFLVVSVVLAVLALKVQTVPAPLLEELVEKSVRHLIRTTDEAEFRQSLANFYDDQAYKWRGVVRDTREILRTKAALLEKAQGFLLAAIVTVSILAASKVFV